MYAYSIVAGTACLMMVMIVADIACAIPVCNKVSHNTLRMTCVLASEILPKSGP